MIKLSYCTFGLTRLDFLAALDAIHQVGYEGVEISFHRDQFNPFDLTPASLAKFRQKLESTGLFPACVATASHFFFPSRPHEPSLMCPDLAGRKRRIDLIRRGIQVARELGSPLVTFGSGFIRHEHVCDPSVDPRALLVDSIHQCLDMLSPEDQITLLIEPEPGMYIETLEQGMALVDEIDSPRFKLHLDLCHAYCSEADGAAAIARAAPYIRYLHVSDVSAGYNLKIIPLSKLSTVNLGFAHYLLYFSEDASFLLLDRKNPFYFYELPLCQTQKDLILKIVQDQGIQVPVTFIEYSSLYAGSTPFDDEVFTYLISVPELSFDVLERAHPILCYLRSTEKPSGGAWIDKRVANTLTGIVHFHEIPGEGSLDFSAYFKALNDNGFSGFASVELYHHVAAWEKALQDSYTHLSQFVAAGTPAAEKT